MLHTFLHPPFADPVKQAQFEALQAALGAEPAAPVSLLLGNFAVEEGGEVFDAVLVRPHSVSVLIFVTNGGQLTVPTQGAGPWQLDGQPVQVSGTANNPFGQFRRLKGALAAWLDSQLEPGHVPAELLTGFALFARPVTFGPGVEQYLRTQPGADSFQLLSDSSQLPRRLRQAAHPEIQLSDAELTAWAKDLADEHPETTAANDTAPTDYSDEPANGFWTQKARQLWHWLGAEDVPHDEPYGSAAAVAANSEEKRQLEQMRQQIRGELAQQRQEMEAREAEREKSIAVLRAQLAQVPTAAPDAAALQARLATETREKEALEAAMHASRAEAASRNQELDARIQQLGQLIEQFQTKPQVPPTGGVGPAATRPAAKATTHHNLVKRPTTQLRWPRVAVVVGAAAGIGLGTWGLTRYVKNKEEVQLNRSAARNDNQPDEMPNSEPSLDALTDTITREIAAVSDSDTLTTPSSETTPVSSENEQLTVPATHDTLYQEPEGPIEPEATDSSESGN
ncbi:hypothetical protein J0X19_05610 [Hymenobacter sp. BT186]|uniref:NERD domain-containing protein n=1 Tax=Hymenobacter telluris TaxID=2816474 RepID=A0A939EWY2_9BACT|nr:hypothetical protein [Hymenobacter telluris]MBO0357413.1 hypothetical protein [Hymenobacter telluris]MBW3373439.1 hypothetical protein [Hymenobacter norwichensis]